MLIKESRLSPSSKLLIYEFNCVTVTTIGDINYSPFALIIEPKIPFAKEASWLDAYFLMISTHSFTETEAGISSKKLISETARRKAANDTLEILALLQPFKYFEISSSMLSIFSIALLTTALQ